MRKRKVNNEPIEIQALRLMLQEYKKIQERFQAKRQKEIEQLTIIDTELEQLTYEDIQNEYGYGLISEAEFERKAKLLEEYQESKIKNADKSTPVTLLLKYLADDIFDISYEIRQHEYNLLSDEEKEVIRKQQEEAEERRSRKRRAAMLAS